MRGQHDNDPNHSQTAAAPELANTLTSDRRTRRSGAGMATGMLCHMAFQIVAKVTLQAARNSLAALGKALAKKR